MTWKTVLPMDQRLMFIADYLRGIDSSFTALCNRFQVSRTTGYKWVHRYQLEGVKGLEEKSRKPKTNPLATPFKIMKAIIELRTSGCIRLGAKKIQTKLKDRFPNTEPPSLTTINNILKGEGLVKPRRKRQRVPIYSEAFKPVTAVNELWSVDFKGQFILGNGEACYPLTIMDHHSRFLLGSDGLKGVHTSTAKDSFERVFREFGLPGRIRSDNGTPFASRSLAGLSVLSVWWIRLGILPERIMPGVPQQNGQHERMHRTMKDAIGRPTSRTMKAQCERLAIFQREYNEERPHESLNQDTPHVHYQRSQKEFPEVLPEIVYPDHFDVRGVNTGGSLSWGGGQIYATHILAGERIGMVEIADGVWDLYFGPVRLGGFDVRRPLPTSRPHPYWSIKV